MTLAADKWVTRAGFSAGFQVDRVLRNFHKGPTSSREEAESVTEEQVRIVLLAFLGPPPAGDLPTWPSVPNQPAS